MTEKRLIFEANAKEILIKSKFYFLKKKLRFNILKYWFWSDDDHWFQNPKIKM